MDRLRRLDALFAERVLGCKPDIQQDSPFCYCNPDSPHGEPDTCCGGNKRTLAYYTRSLDAAWEGIALWQADKIDAVTLHTVQGTWICQLQGDVEMGPDEEEDDFGFCTAEADHPAEALVLACLRAVGTSEDELK